MRRLRRPLRFVFNEGNRFKDMPDPTGLRPRGLNDLNQQRLMYATPIEVQTLDDWVADCYTQVSLMADALCDMVNTTILDVNGLRREAVKLNVTCCNIASLAARITKEGHDASTAPPF